MRIFQSFLKTLIGPLIHVINTHLHYAGIFVVLLLKYLIIFLKYLKIYGLHRLQNTLKHLVVEVFLFKAQFTLRPLERPSPPLCGLQNGDLERGGVEVMEEVGGSPCWLYERRREREGERNSVLFKWESRAQRGRETQAVKPREWRQKEKKSGEIYFAHGEKRETSRREERRRGEKSHRIFLLFFSLNVASFTLMTQRGFRLNSPGQEELMVSFRGSRAEGRNLNALGWTMPALWILTLAITLNQGERCFSTLSLNCLRREHQRKVSF